MPNRHHSPSSDHYLAQLDPLFIRPHMALDGRTLASVPGIEVIGEDKWRTIIEKATRNRVKHD